MLGELNGSHTGARYYSNGPILSTATLGVFYDETYDGDGVKIKEILAKGHLREKTDVTPGCIIEKIDGKPIVKGQDYFPLLEAKPEEKCYWPYIIRLPANVLISPSKLSAWANKVTCCTNVGWNVAAI